MKIRNQRLFLSKKEKNSQNGNGEKQSKKIELVNCNYGGELCKGQLSTINDMYFRSTTYRKNKEYLNSIKALKNAFYITNEMKESRCFKCAELFRSTITRSLEDIQNELHSMSTGFFKTKHYRNNCVEALTVLNDFKKKTNIPG